ncbi:MAG: EthD domain-containing protein [Pseudomonadota bacterium]
MLVRKLVPDAPLYRRNFVMEGAEIAGIAAVSPAEDDFDCITELGFDTRAEAEAQIAAYLDPAIHPIIAADEANFIAPGGLKFYMMEVYQSPGEEPAVPRDSWRPAVPV